MSLPQDEARKAYDTHGRRRRSIAPWRCWRRRRPRWRGPSTIGSIAVGCALGYLDFRFAKEPWRAAHPKLAAWFAKAAEAPALARTVPVG